MSYRLLLWPVMLISTVGLVAVGLSATRGANNAAADPSSGDRLGCGYECQNAGGYGGAGGQPPPPPFARVASGAVQADADGYVPVTVTCMASSTCQGIIVLYVSGAPHELCGGGNYAHDGCSDLLVNANSTRTIGVPLTPAALAYVRANSPVTVEVGVGPGAGPPRDKGTLQVSAT